MMKRFIFVLVAALAVNTAVNAQAVMDGIVINDAELNRNDQVMTVNMDLDFSEFDLSKNEAVLITPYIIRDTLSKTLPSLGFYGRNRYFYYE